MVFDDERIVYVESGEEGVGNGVVGRVVKGGMGGVKKVVRSEDGRVMYGMRGGGEKGGLYVEVGRVGKKWGEE